ncbi:MAG: hypothetical protein MRY83_19675 [Flavobacteriales bacterium]|nr:hypothetical protein [Flavobacteriales bacterium]
MLFLWEYLFEINLMFKQELNLLLAILCSVSCATGQTIKPVSVDFSYIQFPNFEKNDGNLNYSASLDFSFADPLRKERHDYRKALAAKEVAAQNAYRKSGAVDNTIDESKKYFQPLHQNFSEENDFLVINGKNKSDNSDLEIHASTEGLVAEVVHGPKNMIITSIQYPVHLKVYSHESKIKDTTISVDARRFNFALDKIDGKRHRKKELDKACWMLLTENMNAVYNVLNHEYGFSKKKRQTVFYNIDYKKNLFQEYNYATSLSKGALLNLSTQALASKDSLIKAIAIYERYLVEIEQNKKLVDVADDLSKVTYFSLIENNLWIHRYEDAQKYLLELEEFYLQDEDLIKFNELKYLVADQKWRFKQNFRAQN